jgi:enterochelin esterase family protein
MQPDLLERVKKTGAPLIEGEQVTFIWRGRKAPVLIGDFTDWEGSPVKLEKAGRGLWVHTARFPQDAYLEYAYEDPDSGVRLADPFNPRSLSNGVGAQNHWFSMPDMVHTPLTRQRKGGMRGKVSRHLAATGKLARGRERAVTLYRPPTVGPHPLLVVLDGQDYLRRARLVQIVDNLIEQGRIRPIALALVAHGGAARLLEYICSESTLLFLNEIVVPLARQELNLIDPAQSPGACGILGASLGGLMALFAGLRAPHLYGRVLSQSGAFELDGYAPVVMDLVRHIPRAPIEIWMDVGKFESLLDSNRAMKNALLERGYPVTYREYLAGHNYTAWRDDVWRGLESLFPPESRI